MATKPTYEDFLRAATERRLAYEQAQTPPAQQEQGIFGDMVDMAQRGAAQTLGGDLETVGQLTNSQGIKDMGRGVSAWGEGQLQQVSTPMREAMGKQFFQENKDTGAIEAGDAWGDWRAWAGQGATVIGQIGAMVAGTKGAGLLARPVARGAATAFAKDLVEGKAKDLVAKQTVKEAIQNGALDTVRSAYSAAPTEAAKRSVLDQAIGRLGAIGYGAHAGAMASGMRAQQAEQETRDHLNGLDNDKLNATPTYQQAYWELADGEMQGAHPAEIRRAAIDSLAEQAATQAWSDPKAMAADFASGYLTGAVGGVGGALERIGTTRAGAAVRGFVSEGATEAWQGGETQRAVNEAVKEWGDETRDPMAGVLSAALNEGIIGGVAGGSIAGIAGPEAPAPTKTKVIVPRREVTGNAKMDDAIHQFDQRQADRGAALDDEISAMFSGSHNPLGSSKFDPISDIPAYQRQGFVRGGQDFQGTPIVPLEGELLDRGTGVMPLSDSTELGDPVNRSPRYEAAPNRAALEGQSNEVAGLTYSPEPQQIGQSDTIFSGGEPGADQRNSAYTPPRLSRDHVDTSLGEQSTRDPRSPVSQSIANAGSATDSVFGPLQSLRVTRKGKPFATEKEAAMASRKDQEMPVPLNGGGFGVAQIAEVQQVQSEERSFDPGHAADAARKDPRNKAIVEEFNKSRFDYGDGPNNPPTGKKQLDPFADWHTTASNINEDDAAGYQAHGVAKTDPLGSLLNLLEHGVDPRRQFHTSGLLGSEADAALGIAGGAYKDGPFIVLGERNKNISDGIKTVLVTNEQSGVIPSLRRRFPSVDFVKFSDAGDYLAEKAAGQAPVKESDLPAVGVSGETVTAPVQAEASQIKQQSSNTEQLTPSQPITEKQPVSADATPETSIPNGALFGNHKLKVVSVGRKWITATSPNGSAKVQVEKNALSEHWQPGQVVEFHGAKHTEAGKYGSKVTFYPRDQNGQETKDASGLSLVKAINDSFVRRSWFPDQDLSRLKELNTNGQFDSDIKRFETIKVRERAANLKNQWLGYLSDSVSQGRWYAKAETVLKEQAAKLRSIGDDLDADKIDSRVSELRQSFASARAKATNKQSNRQIPTKGRIDENDPSIWGHELLGYEGESWSSFLATEDGFAFRQRIAGEASQQPAEVTPHEQTPAVAPVSSEQQGDQPGAGEPVLPVVEPSPGDGAGLPAADNAGGAAPDAASMEPQQDDQTLNWSEPKSAEDYRKAQGRLFAGDMSYAEFKAMSRAMLDNAGALRAELEQKTKAELLQMMNAFNAARYKNEKKAAVVEAAYNQLLGDLRWAANGSSNTISETYALGGKRQSIEERVSSALDGLTEARYQQFIDKQHADMAELERRRAALKQALTDPQTLEDFRAFVERRGSDKLTTEQRARYEDLVAASNMDKREAARDAKAEAKVTETAAGDIIQTKHSKTGEELFVVQMGDRVDRDTYNTVNAKANEMGGWYSSFRGKGAVPGFQFKDKAKAAEFKGWLAGETATQAKPEAAPTEITEPSNDGGKGKQVETLRQRADSVRAKADAALNAERKENTAKRAGQAAHARANAERDLRFAGLLDAIATGIEAGEITYLRNLANGAQLEELQSALNRGLWNLPSAKVDELVSQGVIERDNNSRYSWSDKATPEQQVEGVTMPGMDYYTDRLRDAAFKMQSASGFKQAGVKIMSLVKAATNRDSKRVTLSDPELIAKLKAFVNGSDDFSTSTIKDQIAGYSRLERMGITNQTELRAALRELVRLQKGLDKRAPQSDPLAEQARNLKLRLLNNRNAFIDFFPTPEEHASDLAARAGIEPGMKVLEPSAGHGMLADAARAAGASVDAVELASDLRDILQTKGYPLVGTDFMATEAKGDYDAVIMNPPFSNDMDIDHVRHAYDHLKPGGRLVAIVSAMAGERSNRKNKAFAEWLESLGAEQEMMPEGAFKDSLNPTSVRTKIITIEKPSDAVQGPTIKAGSRATLHTPKGKPVEVQYRLVEAGDLVASHEFDGTVNRAYPQEMQPRDRSKGTYQVQVRQIANNPEGQRLGASPETDRGAPIVRDGVVESGNGRTIGLKQAYRQGSAEHYRAWLVAHAADFGLSPDEVAAMSQPVLVRERLTEMDAAERRDFVVDSNTDAKMANSASEDAKADAGRLDDRLLGMLNIPEGGNLLALSNEPFLNAFARAIGENSLNQYKDDKGRWNDAYQRRVANAIFAYGYDSDSLLKAATGDSDSAGKNLTSAMMNNAAKVAELRAAMPDHAKDLVALLTEAVETMNSARRNGQSIAEVVSQGDMMSGGVSHAGGALAEMLADASRSAKRLTETVGAILDMLNESASHAGQVDMLTGEQARTITAEEAINAQAREYRLRKEREQAAPRSSGDLFGVAGPRNDHGKDSGVSGSAGQGQEQGSDGGLTVEGVSIAIPTIDQGLQESYNSVTYRGKGPDVVAGIRAEVGRILLTLKESGLLETPDQKSLAQKLVQRWADEEAGNAIKKMRFGVQNPSWMITGRSGRKQGSNSALDAENRREAEHHKEQSARIQRAKAALKELRSPDIIRAETFKNEWRSARAIIAEMGSYITSNRTALLAEYRKNVNKTLMGHLNAMQEADPARFSAELSAQDQRLRDAGMTGLVEVVGPRSNPGKLIAQNIDAPGGVRFSKQSQTEGPIPTKHMTRKEAELVTREWLKQYQGVAGIDIQIHATQAEMELALGLEPKDGLIRRAAFDRDESGLHVAADTISNARQLREILRHEVLAHYGLANVLGGGEYTNLMSRIIKSKDDPSMRDVWQWVETHYADEDIGVQAEEVIAHLAELEPSAWRRGWEKVVNWLTKALRAVGFLPSSHVSATEIRSLVEALGNELQGGKSKPVPEGQRFSQRKDESAEGRDIRMSQTVTDSAMDKLSLGVKPDIIDRAKERLEALRGTDKSTVKKWVDRFIKKANTEMLDALAPIKYAEDAAGVTEAGDSGYVAARLASGSAATMQATMLYGLPEWKDGVIQRKAGTGESDALLGIFEGLGKDLHNWLGWMAGHRAEILMKEGRENLLTADEIAALKALDKGKEAQFQEAKQKWNAVNKAVLDLAEEAGLFTKADRANWENEWYIPFFRESEDGDAMAPFKAKGLANQSAGIKKLKGGTEHTADLLENIFSSTGKLIDASMKNMAAQKIVWNLADTDLIEVVAKPNMMDWRAIKNDRELITVKVDGEDYMLRVNDPDLYRAMTFFDREPFGKGVQLASKAKRLLTAGVTASPEFMFRNFMRDSLSAWAISKDGFKPVVDSIKGIRKTLAMDGSTLDVMFSGSSFLGGYVNGNDPGAMADSVRKALRRKGMTPEQISKYEKSIIRNAKQAQEVIAGAWDKYAKYGEAFENANREAVYDAAIKAGKSHAQAAFEAKDLMDFSMLGASRSMQLFVQLLPFFNARVQGLGKLGRELRDNPRAIARRAGMITAASLALLAMNWDDDRYKDLPDWDKDANWHFFLGDQHFRIPKPFEIGVMFATVPERMVRAAGGADTGEQLGKALARSFMDTFALNPTPQVVKPLVESYFNYDTFRGAPIENMADLAVRAEARYNENTSLLMREIGQATGMSPKKLEHLMIGYTGTIGSYVMAAADGLIRAMSPGESAAWRADEIPVVKAFYRGSAPAKSTQQMEQFYSMLDEVNKLKRTVDQYRKEGMTDEAKALLDEQGAILRARSNMSRTQQQIRQLRNEMELIQRDRILTADQKRERLDKLMSKRNALVAESVKRNQPLWE